MKPEFNKIYENLYADYVYDADKRSSIFVRYNEYELLKTIRRSIDNSDKEDKLRPDAKYFLLTNFHNLIVRPLIDDYRYVLDNPDLSNLGEYIAEDIQTIINTTTNEISTDSEKISGHQIMSTINGLWKTLKTTSFDIWG